MLIILQLFLEVKVTTGLNPGQLKVSILSNASEQLDPILGLAGFGLVLQISLMPNNFHNNSNSIDNNMIIITTIKTATTTRTTIFVQFADLGIEHVQCSTDLATLPYDLSNLIKVGLYIYIKTYMPIDMHQDT